MGPLQLNIKSAHYDYFTFGKELLQNPKRLFNRAIYILKSNKNLFPYVYT